MAISQITGSSMATDAVSSSLGYTPVNKAGDTMSGNLTFTTGKKIVKTPTQLVEEFVVDSSSRGTWNPYMSYTADAGSINRFWELGAWDNNGARSPFLRSSDTCLRLNNAGFITGAGLVARGQGIASTNGNNESSGQIVFPSRGISGTNIVVATATNVTSSTMITAEIQYVNIYDWSNSTIWAHGSKMAMIRSSSATGTTAHNYAAHGATSGGSAVAPTTWAWTGSTTLNLNWTNSGSNEGIAVIKIAWRDCTISIAPQS